MVTVFFWNKGSEESRKWNTKQYYHARDKGNRYCWIEQGLDYLTMNPYIPYTRHKKAKLTERQTKMRVVLLRRKAALDQRKKKVKSDYPDRVLIDARLNKQIAELMVKIAPIGGVPKKWLENLT